MRTLSCLMLAAALAACGGSSKPATTTPPATTEGTAPAATPAATTAPADGSMAEAFAQMESYTNQMCACTTSDCADLVMKAMTEWSAEFTKRAPKDQAPTEEEQKRMVDIATRMGECAQKAMQPAQDK